MDADIHISWSAAQMSTSNWAAQFTWTVVLHPHYNANWKTGTNDVIGIVIDGQSGSRRGSETIWNLKSKRDKVLLNKKTD